MIDLKAIHAVVYIDAWKQDFSNDPMLSVVSSIINQLQALLPKEDKTISETLGKASEFMKAIAPIVAKGVMKKATGIDLNDDGEHDLTKADEAMLGDIAAKVTDKMIKNHNSTLNSIATFKIAIKEWIEAIQVKSDSNSPTFIFIDELDRCRPTYAVQMLEVIKHFFEMDNIIFVVATDTEQLQHAIKAVYGREFGAQTYLGRFFNRRCTLQSVSKEYFIQNYITQKFKPTESIFEERDTWPKLRGKDDFVNLIFQLEVAFDLSLRDLEQFIDKVISVILSTDKKINIIFLIYLFMLHESNKTIYDDILNSQLTNFHGILKRDGLVLNKIGVSKIKFTDGYVTNNNESSNYEFTLNELLTVIIESMHMNDDAKYNKTEELSDNLFLAGTKSDIERLKNLHAIYTRKDIIGNYKNWIELAVSFDV